MRRAVPAALLASLSACNLVHGPPKDGECRSNLITIMANEQAYKAEHGRFTLHPAEVGFAPPPGNRYLYRFAPEGPVSRRDGTRGPPPSEAVGLGPDTRSRGVTAEWLDERLPKDLRAELGVRGTCPDCVLTVGCAGNIDDDDTVDVWSISSEDRPTALRGSPLRHVDDRRE